MVPEFLLDLHWLKQEEAKLEIAAFAPCGAQKNMTKLV